MITDFKYAFADDKTDAEEDVMMRIANKNAEKIQISELKIQDLMD